MSTTYFDCDVVGVAAEAFRGTDLELGVGTRSEVWLIAAGEDLEQRRPCRSAPWCTSCSPCRRCWRWSGARCVPRPGWRSWPRRCWRSGAVWAAGSDINPAGDIVGGYQGLNGRVHGFVVDRDWNFTFIDFPDAVHTRVFGINARGDLVGSYVDTSNRTHGFVALRTGAHNP